MKACPSSTWPPAPEASTRTSCFFHSHGIYVKLREKKNKLNRKCFSSVRSSQVICPHLTPDCNCVCVCGFGCCLQWLLASDFRHAGSRRRNRKVLALRPLLCNKTCDKQLVWTSCFIVASLLNEHSTGRSEERHWLCCPLPQWANGGTWLIKRKKTPLILRIISSDNFISLSETPGAAVRWSVHLGKLQPHNIV